MTRISQIIDLYKVSQGIGSDSEMARRWNVSPQYIHQARRRAKLSDEQCLELARGTNIEGGVVMVARNADRSHNATSKAWSDLLAKTVPEIFITGYYAVISKLHQVGSLRHGLLRVRCSLSPQGDQVPLRIPSPSANASRSA